MNNTKTLTVAAVLMAAALVVGTFATMATTTQSAFAIAKKPPGEDNKKTRDNGSGNSGNGNTITTLKCQNKGSASGFDTTTNQECENLICTHPGNNATCTQEGVTSAPPTSSTSTSTPTPTTIQVSGQGEGVNVCPSGVNFPANITFSAQKSGNAAVQGQFEINSLSPNFDLTKTGTLDSVQITGNSFTATGTEVSQEPRYAGTLIPSSATITGQCGTGVTIQFATADGEHATFTNANVQCTTT